MAVTAGEDAFPFLLTILIGLERGDVNQSDPPCAKRPLAPLGPLSPADAMHHSRVSLKCPCIPEYLPSSPRPFFPSSRDRKGLSVFTPFTSTSDSGSRPSRPFRGPSMDDATSRNDKEGGTVDDLGRAPILIETR